MIALNKVNNIFIGFVLLLISISAFSKDSYDWEKVKCTKDLTVLTREAIKLQLSGQNLTDRSTCLKRSDFKYFAPLHEPSRDSREAYDVLISNDAQIKIADTKRDDSIGLVSVKFEIIDGKKVYKDSLKYMFIRGQKIQSKLECNSILEATQKKYLYNKCK